MKIADKTEKSMSGRKGAEAEGEPVTQSGNHKMVDAEDSECVATTPLERDDQQSAVQLPSDDESSDIQSTDSSSSSSNSGEDAPDMSIPDIAGSLWRNKRISGASLFKCQQTDCLWTTGG